MRGRAASSPGVVQQQIARFADKAGAPGDAGEERDQRRLPRVRQHDRLAEPPAQRLPEARSFAEL